MTRKALARRIAEVLFNEPGLTRNMVELRVAAQRECRVSWVQSSVSCGNSGELKAHLASVGVQAVETSCLVRAF